MGERYEPEFAWACAWSNGSPRPFLLVNHIAMTRRDAIARFAEAWATNDREPPMKVWRRVYRQGARCIRVRIEPAFAPPPHSRNITAGGTDD